MLIVGRKCQEKIIIQTPAGDTIVVIVKDIDHGTVRIGVQASPEVTIDREEIWLRKQAEKNAT